MIRKNTTKRILEAEKVQQQKSLAYVTTYNNNNLELFIEVIKNLEELKINEKIEEILNTAKVIKSQRQHKNLKRIRPPSIFGENTSQVDTKCKKKDEEYEI